MELSKRMDLGLRQELFSVAMKCSSATINGELVDVFKDPITDRVKASKKGRVTLWQSGGEFQSSVEQ
ncbi:MAG: hypothetical protein WCI05_11175, partial [Myxococcales bacterium]